MNENRCVMVMSEAMRAQARVLADELNLPMLSSDPNWQGLALCVSDERLELREFSDDAPGPVYVDFIGGAVGHRRRFGGGKGQLIAKAVGVKKDRIPYVVDATAGLGRDSFVLAQLGCRVQMVERSPIVAALLQDGMTRAMMDDEVAEIVGRMSLQVADAAQWLAALSEEQRPDVVYVDPMHPERTKAASVKKEMRLFRELVGGDEDDARLLEAALGAACKRVVVKRPRKAVAIDGPKPSLVMDGKSTRYDIYLR